MWYKSFWLTLGICLDIAEALALSGETASAQINLVPDNTLGAVHSDLSPTPFPTKKRG